MPGSRKRRVRAFDTLLVVGAIVVVATSFAGWHDGVPEVDPVALLALALAAIVVSVAGFILNTSATQGSTPFVLGVVLAVVSGTQAEGAPTVLPLWAIVGLATYAVVLGRGRAGMPRWAIVVLAGQAMVSVGRMDELGTAPYSRLLVGLAVYFAGLWLLDNIRERLRGSQRPSLTVRQVVFGAVGAAYAGWLLGVLHVLSRDDQSRAVTVAIAGVTVLGVAAGWLALRVATLRRLSEALIQAAVATPWPSGQVDETLTDLVRRHVRASSVGMESRPGEPEALSQQVQQGRFLVVRREPGDFAFSRYDGQLVAGLASMARASHDLDAKVAQLETRAVTDDLTGLLEYGAWREILDQLLDEPGTGQRLAVVFFDLDHFKQLNTKHGHLRADDVLAAVGARLRKASSDWRFARFGGDEFVGVLREVRDAAALDDACAALGRIVAEPVESQGREIVVTATIGRALAAGAEGAPDSAARLVGRAEADLRRRKAARPTGSLPTDEDVVHALLDGGLEVVYQPVFSMPDGELQGWEALLRGSVGSHGPMSPVDLVGAAGRLGVLDVVSLELARQALATAEEAVQRTGRRLSMSINLEAAQLTWDSRLLHWVLERAAASPAHLVLELTERGDTEWTADQAAVADELGRRGVGLAIDDFGTGQSRMTALARHTWAWVKLDRGFLADERSRVLLRHTVRMLDELGTPVVLEGVETAEHRALAADLGVAYAQGRLLGPPVPAARLLATLPATTLPAHLPAAVRDEAEPVGGL